MKNLVAFLKDESGASAAEYALILAIVAAVLIVAIGGLANSIGGAVNLAAKNI